MINLTALADRLDSAGVLNKTFLACDRLEILAVCEAVFSCVGDEVPEGGWKTPYIKDDELIVPHDVHPSYYWWTVGGKPIQEILVELDASFYMASNYINKLTPERWEEIKNGTH